jgi:hypothetical protein
MVSDAFEHMAKISLGIELVEPGGLDQGIGRGSRPPA